MLQALTPSPSAYWASERGQTLMVAPVLTKIFQVRSGSAPQWLKVLSGPTSLSAASASRAAAAARPWNSVVMRNPSRRAIAQFSRTGPENMRSVTSWSAEEKYFFCSRSRSAGHWRSHSPAVGGPEAWTARMPLSISASTAASEWAALRELCELSITHVMPASMQPIAVR